MKRDQPAPLNQSVRARMVAQKRTNTKPEVTLRSELHRRGLRFRLRNAALPGKPDFVLVRTRLAVFVDGCFWHGCPSHFVAPKNNRDWWLTKIQENQQRDQRVDRQLAGLGWLPVRVWEHELTAGADLIEHLHHERRLGTAGVRTISE